MQNILQLSKNVPETNRVLYNNKKKFA